MKKEKNELLKLVNINKTYKMSHEKIKAIDNVNLSLNSGEIIGLVGESGCGKSTLARIIVGLEKIDSGEIFFEGKKVTNKNIKEFRKRIQLIFQDSISALDPKISIYNSVFEPLDILYKKRTNENEIKVERILSDVGIKKDNFNKLPAT